MNVVFVFVLLSIIMGVVFYVASDSLMIGALILIIFLITSLLNFVPTIKKYSKATQRYHACFHFINNFIISLSIKKSIPGALESTSLSMDDEFNTIYKELENFSEAEKLKYLVSYFPFHIFQLFLQIVEIWQEEGGDILEMAKFLLNQARNEETYVSETVSLSKRKYIESASLWAICLAILVFLRFSLRDFYTVIKGQPLYLGSLVVLGVFVLFSVFMTVQKSTQLKLKGYDKNEKII